MNLQLSQIRSWLGIPPGEGAGAVCGYSIDSRSIQPGELFFAIRGPRHDGHDFVADALRRGAVAAVVEPSFGNGDIDALLRVGDPAAALRALAAHARQAWGQTVIAVTGSSGKTTTKDAIAELLGEAMPVAKSEGNLNNEYGLPLSLLRVPDEARAAVVEIGINHAGEMRPLARVASPDVSVVTNVGAAHLGNFPSVEAIADEKRCLVEALSDRGTAVLNADDVRVSRFGERHEGPVVTFGIDRPADVRAEEIEDLGACGVRFRVGEHSLQSALLGRHNVYNVLASLAAMQPLGIEPGPVLDAVERLRPASMRGVVQQVGDVTLIDDCYNANPAAMAAMLDVLRRTPAKRRIAVLGEMRELGGHSKQLHRQVGQAVREAGIDRLIAVGGDAAEIASSAGTDSEFHATASEAADAVVEQVGPGDAVLLKASRGVGLEAVRDALLEALGDAAGQEGKVA